MKEFKKYLQDNFQFSEDEWESIKDYAEPINFPKQKYFVQEDKVSRNIAFIEKGVMRYCMRKEGEDITCYFIYENWFAGDPDSFFPRKPSEKNLQALTDCELICITRTNLDKLIKACPRFLTIIGLIDHKVMIELLVQRDLLLHADAEEKYRKFMDQYPQILQRVPLGYIASFLGITQQSLSRLRKQIS